jgi:hypothetical protein
MATKHEMVKLGPDLFLIVYRDHSIALTNEWARPLVMMDAQQAKKLVESIHHDNLEIGAPS